MAMRRKWVQGEKKHWRTAGWVDTSKSNDQNDQSDQNLIRKRNVSGRHGIFVSPARYFFFYILCVDRQGICVSLSTAEMVEFSTDRAEMVEFSILSAERVVI